MAKTNGSIIGPANIPTGAFGSAPGVWKLSEAEQYKKEGIWPVATTGFQVANSCRFNSGSSDYLSNTFGTPTNAKIYTFSTWVKRSSVADTDQFLISGYDGSGSSGINFSTAADGGYGQIRVYEYAGSYTYRIGTNNLLRDCNGWYHIVIAYDSTQATDTNRLKIYINGTEASIQTSNPNHGYPSLNFESRINKSGLNCAVGRGSSSAYLDGYMSEVVFIDGTALTPSSFGETDATTGNWIPKDVSGLTFGNNGFYLPFQNASALGQDDSGNGNNFTVNNLTSIDQCIDSPTNNFATINVLSGDHDEVTTSNGNLTLLSTTQTNTMVSTLGVSQGKWYWEAKINGSNTQQIGIIEIGKEGTLQDKVAGDSGSNGYILLSSDGSIYNNGSVIDTGSTFTTNDIIGIALDLDNNYIYIYKNGTLTNTGGTSITNSSYFAASSAGGGSDLISASYNFGNAPFTISSGNTDFSGLGNFEYEVPSGYRALCTKNIGLVG